MSATGRRTGSEPARARHVAGRVLRVASMGVALGLGAVPSAAAFEFPASWTSEHYRDNPLAGTIVTGSGGAVDAAAFDRALGAARYVLIGETHTNADHHAIQARILADMVAAGGKPAVVFEMIPEDFRPRLDAYLAAPERTAEGLGAAVDWEKRGWPAWATYRPIAEVALAAGLAIRPGDLPRETIRAIGTTGAAALAEGEAARLGLDRAMPEAEERELSEELRVSHCGLLPEKAVAPMLTVQRARDGALADATIAAARETGTAVLIAGAGHVRKDWAVPALIAAREAGAEMVSIGLMEVSEGEDAPADYGLSAEEPAPYDFVVFTPREDISDPCEGMAEAMRGMKPAK